MKRIVDLIYSANGMWIVLLMAIAMTLPVIPAGAQGPGDLTGDSENGAELFKTYTCYGCHGYTGETGLAPRLNPMFRTQEGFIAYLRNPSNPRRMPPYQQDEATDQNLADIYAYILSLPSGSPDAENIPILDEILEEVEDEGED